VFIKTNKNSTGTSFVIGTAVINTQVSLGTARHKRVPVIHTHHENRAPCVGGNEEEEEEEDLFVFNDTIEGPGSSRVPGLGSSSLVAHVPPPHANSFVLGPAVINTHINTHRTTTGGGPG